VAAPDAQNLQDMSSTGGQVDVSAGTIQQSSSGLIDVSGAIAGSVTLQGVQNIDLSGSILAVGSGVASSSSAAQASPAVQDSPAIGGSVLLTAQQDVTLQDVNIDVSGADAGGTIEVRGGQPAPSQPPGNPPVFDLLGTSELEASSRRGKGGTISLTAGQVNLLDGTTLDASGAAGGGDVYVGGGFRGQDPSIADAQQSTIGSGVSIDASATQAGDGGQVVVWSSEQTNFAGSIQARGGAQGGAGGIVEVSGAQLDYTGTVNAGAPQGPGGSLLLDPQNLTVDSSGTDSLSNETFSTNPSTDSVIAPSAITAVTDTGTAVTLQANNDLTINSSIVTSAGGAGGAMTFEAGNSIAVDASVISDNGDITFTANDSDATAADRAAGTATFDNKSVIDAGSGTVNITLGTFSGVGAASGTIETGHVVAANLNVTQDGPTTGAAAGAIDLGETDLTGNLSISANSDRNVTNTLGAEGTGGEVVVRGTATISVGAGDVTIDGPDTDFNIIGLTAGNVTLNDASAMQFAASTISGNLVETTVGPMASTGPVQVTGSATLTADDGGFGYADPYIDFSNSGNHFGSLALDVGSRGGSSTGGYVTITDSAASGTTINSSTTASSLTVQAAGPVITGTITAQNGSAVAITTSSGGVTAGTTTAGNLSITAKGAVSLGTTNATNLTVNTNGEGAISNTGAITVGQQTTLTAGSANDITLDNSSNRLNYVQIVSGDDVTLVDTSGIVFGSDCSNCGGLYNTISGALNVTAGGDITQQQSGIDGYSRITIAGATTFTANGSAPIQLILGSSGDGGEENTFSGGVTVTRTDSDTGFSNLYIRDENPNATVLNGITNVGTLDNVTLVYDKAPAVTLPGMTLTGSLQIYAQSVANTGTTASDIISQSGPLVVGGNAIFKAASTGDIDLTNAGNDFNDFAVTGARNVTVVDANAIALGVNTGNGTSIGGNLQITTNGEISDSSSGQQFTVSGTTTLDPGSANNILLSSGRDDLNILAITAADNVTVKPLYSLTMDNATIGGTLTISSNQGNGWLQSLGQVAGSSIDMTGGDTATFDNFINGIVLNQPDNVFGPIAIGNSGTINIAENAPITQSGAWKDQQSNGVGYAVTLATTNQQAITLNNSGNYLGALLLTQNGSAVTPGAVTIYNANNNAGITQAGAWNLAGPTTLESYGYSITLTNRNNVLGPLQVLSSSGTTNGVASSITIDARNTGSTDAISDVEAAGGWTTGTSETVELVGYDSAGTTEGGGDITLTDPANVLGQLYIKGHNVTITENANIIDGPVLNNWDGAGDNGWATTGSMSLVVANPSGKSIDLSNLDNLIGPIALSTTGTAGTLQSVLITDNENLTQNGAWVVGSAPVTLDARTHGISLTNSANVMGDISINTANGTPSSVAITEDDDITQGSAWVLTGVPVTLDAENGNSITLTNASNIMGDLVVTGGAVNITENGDITQPCTSDVSSCTTEQAWNTTGTTTLNPTKGSVVLTNPDNVLGDVAIGGTPGAVSITENDDITQAAAWVEPSTPFTLDSGAGHDIDLGQAGNELGKLTLTGQDAMVTESDPAGITEAAAWSIPGTVTLTAGAGNPIELTASPANDLGTLTIDSASGGEVDTADGVVIGGATISAGGTLTLSAGGPITQTGAIDAPSLQLIGAGEATLTNASNDVSTLAAGFTGGDLAFTNSGDFTVGPIGQTSGVTIGAHDVMLTSVNGTIDGLTTVNPGSASLTITTGAALTLPQMSIAGPQTYSAGGSGITLTAEVLSTQAGDISFNSPVTLASDLTVQSTESAVTFGSTVAGGTYQLNVDAADQNGGGPVTFVGAVSGLGRSSASAALSVSSSGALFDTTLDANNGLAITGPVTFSDTVTLGDGGAPSIFDGPVTLGKAGGMDLSGYTLMNFEGGVLLQNGPATIESNNSALNFTAGTVSGPYALTLDSGTAALTGLDRMGSDLTGLTVTALSPTIPVSGLSISGPQTYTATSSSTITLDGNVTSTAAGAITFNDPVVLGAAVTVASVNSPVDFGATVDGNKNLTVDAGTGTTEFTGAVGAVTPVGSGTGAAIVLEGTGTTTFDSTVQTRSGITAADPVVFDANVTLGDGDTASVFSSNVTAGSSTGSTLTADNGIAFGGGLTLAGGAVTVDSNGSTIALGGPVTGAESLTLDALGGGAGTVTGLDQIGPTSDLTALDVTAQTLSLPSGGLAVAGPMTFTAAGGITLNGAVGSAAGPATGAVTFNGPMTLATQAVVATTDNAPILFNGTVDGAESLAVNAGTGTITFADDVGDTTAISSLQTGSQGTTVVDAGSIDTSGAQTYGGLVTLGADATLSGDDVQFAGTLDGTHALTISDSGTTSFGGAVGGAHPLTSLSVTAADGIVADMPSVTTTGAQSYDGAVTLGTDATFSGNGIDFGSTVDGDHALTANADPGTLTFAGAVGGAVPLASLSAAGEQLSAGNVSTTGAQSYTAVAGVSLNGALQTDDGTVTVTGPTALTGDTSIATNGGDINFSGSTSTINGNYALTLTAGTGNVLLGSAVGGATALSGFSDSGNDLTLPDVTTDGDANQSYTALDNITLTQSRTLNAPVSFTADADGDGAGSFILQNGVSLTASNHPLSITAADIDLQGSSTLSSGTGVMEITATDGRNIYLGGTTTAPGQLTITGDELSRMSSSGGLMLNTTGSGWIDVNGITAQQSQNITGTLNLEAQGNGDISFVSAASTFSGVKTDAATGSTNIGVNLTTVGHDAEFVTPVTISGASTIASGGGNIKFDSGVSVANDLTLNTGNGTLTFGGPVGSTSTLTLDLGGGSVAGLSQLQSSLTGLTVNGSAAITLPAIDINGPQVYETGSITLTGDLAGTGIEFDAVVTAAPSSGSALTLNAGTGTLAFNDLANFQATDMTLTADDVGFAKPVAATGNLAVQPYTANADIAVGGSGAPITGLNLTAADLGELPLANLASLTIGGASDTGAIDVAGALNVSATPLTLNGGGGITQSGGAITSGAFTLETAGNAIDLPNPANAFGAVAIDGTPTAVTLTNSKAISQQASAGWALDSAPVTLDAGSADITLDNSGNTFGTLELTGANATVSEAAATDLGTSNLTGDLALTSAGGINFSGPLSAQGNVSLSAAGEITQAAPLVIGGNLDAATTVNAGDVSIDNSGAAATTLGDSEVGGNYSVTATGETVTQALNSAIQVAGDLTVTADTVDLTGAANLVRTTSLPASDTTVIEQPGVIELSSGNYSGNLTVISQRTNRSFGSTAVSGSAIMLDDSSNSIGGIISVSASPPTIVTGPDEQTGITQQAGSSLEVGGIASFTAEDSSAGSLGISLSNSGNQFGTLQLTGTTAVVNNAATAATTLENSQATTSLTIVAAGGVTQTGALSTPTLSVDATGPITLDDAGNQIGSVSATSSGNAISVVDAADLSVAGIDAGGAAVSLSAGGSGNLTQTGAITDVTSLTADAGGAVTLTNTGNTIQSLAVSSAGTGLQLYDSNGLDVTGDVNTAAGDLTVRAAGDITLQGDAALAADAGNVVVSTEGAGNFMNDSTAAADALQVGTGDRWLVYSDTPDLVSGPHTEKGGLTSNFRSYDATYSSYAPDSVTQSGDGFIYDYAQPTLVVNAAINGSATQVYGDDPTGTLTYTIVSGLVDSEDGASNVITGGVPTYSMALGNSLNAGTYTISYTGGLTSNYALQADPTGVTYTVTPAVLSYVADPQSRTYGASNPALTGTVTGFKLTDSAANVLSGTLSFSTSATAASPVGSYAIDGSGYTTNGNYTLQQAAGNATSLTVTPASLTVTANDDTETYNATAFSGGAGVTYSGFVNGESASVLGGTLTYGGSAQGALNAGSYSIAPSGITAGNYTITYQPGTLTIDPASLEVTTSAVTKTYDGTLSGSGTPITTGGTQLFGTDYLSGGTYTFADANAGNGNKTVTVSGVTVHDGNGGQNYAVTYVANAQSTINPASITVSTADVTKTYDGTGSALGTLTVSGTLYHNATSGTQDSLSGGTFAFSDPNAGTADKTVTVSDVTVNDGNGGANYDVTYAPNTTSTISPATLTFSGTIADKTYDATTTASLSGYTLNGLVGDQTLGVTVGAANFSDPNAGTDKPVTIGGITLTDGTNGGLASNYIVSATSPATGTIDPKMLTVNAVVENKVYNGSTAAVVDSYGLSGLMGDQTVRVVDAGTASFDDKNVGDGKQVSITGVTLVDGANGGLATNYAVPSTVTASADITPATLQIAGVIAENKVYDGNTTAYLNTQSAVLTGVIDSDDVGVSTLTGTFATKNVGTNIAIGTGTVVLSGADAGNYTLVQPSGLSADITPRPLTVSATGVNKVYDGSTKASVALSDDVLPGDTVTVSSSSAFLDANAGASKYVDVSGITLGGADARNYVANSSTSTSADITPAPLVVTAAGENKLYDGTTAAQVTLSADSLPGDQVTLGDASATFASADPGTGKTVTVDGIYVAGGADAGNYVVEDTTTTTTADITGSVIPTPPNSAAVEAGQWSLPPAMPTPQPPTVPTPPASVLDVSLPATFGTFRIETASTTGGGTTTDAGAFEAAPNGTASVSQRASSAIGSVSTGAFFGAAGGGAAAATQAPAVTADTAVTASPGYEALDGGSSEPLPHISVSLIPATVPMRGMIVVSIPDRLMEQGNAIHIPLPTTVASAIGNHPVTVTGLKGGKLPRWLRYERATHSFVASEMAAAILPYKALVRSGGHSWVVLVTEGDGV
jgi:hypothetical protein